MASPHAAGCAALLIQSGEATTPTQIELRLKTSAVYVTVPINGLSFPRIDCRPPAPTPTPTSTTTATPTMTATPTITPTGTVTGTTPMTPTVTLTPTMTATPNPNLFFKVYLPLVHGQNAQINVAKTSIVVRKSAKEV
jgi:hypothetical protein